MFVECPWGGPLGLCYCGSLWASKYFFPSLVYVYSPRAQNGPLRPSINEDKSQLSLRRSWGHWREHSQAPATPGREEGLCALGEAGVWNPGWPPGISSSPTRWKEVLFPFKQPHLLPHTCFCFMFSWLFHWSPTQRQCLAEFTKDCSVSEQTYTEVFKLFSAAPWGAGDREGFNQGRQQRVHIKCSAIYVYRERCFQGWSTKC